eukprot:scaffold91829_cov60-Phaeocystis_antarctica.AAC.6
MGRSPGTRSRTGSPGLRRVPRLRPAWASKRAVGLLVPAERAGVTESVLVGTRRKFCHVIEAIYPRVGLLGAPGASAPS